MSNYYRHQRLCFQRINDILSAARSSNTEIDINSLIVNLTDIFEVSEKCILKRLERIRKIDKDFDLICDTIVWKPRIEITKKEVDVKMEEEQD